MVPLSVVPEHGQAGRAAKNPAAHVGRGVGIEPQYLPYLFDRLYRVETSRVRDDDSGSGLGLSIVRRLTLLLGGRISVRSTPGEGTEFTVWLLGARMVDV